MTTIVRVLGPFEAAETLVAALQAHCDHCRGALRSSAHRYWRMRFCSAVCMKAYQQRLSTHTQQKIFEIESYPSLWKAAS
jgi:hypothetical protein